MSSSAPVVLDAAVVIAFLDAHDDHHQQARELFRAQAGAPKLMNVLNYAETLVGPTRRGRGDDAVRALRALQIRQVSIEDTDAQRLAELRAQTGSKMPDCCVLLTAERHAASIATFDERLQASARQIGVALT